MVKKIKNKLKKSHQDDAVAPASSAIFKEALLQDQREKLERDGKRFADVEEEIATLRMEADALREVLTPLVKALGVQEKEFGLRDGRRLVVENVGGGRSATKKAIVKQWGQDGEVFWAKLPKRDGHPRLSAKGPKDN